jgi:ferredoxin
MQVSVDRTKCQGHARCNALCPEVFDLDIEGYSTVSDAEVPDQYAVLVDRAVFDCPEGAISTS